MKALNISKINDGIFIGDKMAATNFNVLKQYKISHLINTCGNQIQCNLESSGIKYLTLNWQEYPSNNNIYINEDTVKKILYFIDDSIQNGDGLMIYSVRGQNRACVAIIIYLMEKYKWTLKKCKDYLSTKKKDININKSYMNQLLIFEQKLIKNNNTGLINDWNNDDDLEDDNELLMKNTYLNDVQLTKKKYLFKVMIEKYKNDLNNNIDNSNKENNKIEIIKEKPHIQWIDHLNSDNCEEKNLLYKYDINKDLFLQKRVRVISNLLWMKPIKPCIKNNYVSEKNFNEKTCELENNIKKDITEDNSMLNKNRYIEENTIDTKILRNAFIEGNMGRSRKLTYDNQDNLTSTENREDNSNDYKILDNEKRNKTDDYNFENEKNNNIKNDKIDININENISEENVKEYNQYKEKLLRSSNNHINNFMKNNKYTKYFLNSNKNIKKRAISSKKNKKINEPKLPQNKRYYLGTTNPKKTEENEKDINFIPDINPNKTQNSIKYKSNLSFNKKNKSIRTSENSKDNKINKFLGTNYSYSSKKKNNNQLLKNNYNFKIKNKPKNANIFDNYNSYNFESTKPVKINNKITYKLSNSVDKKNDNFLSGNSKIFNNLNTYATISKEMNNIKQNKMNKLNRPFSARTNNTKNYNNNYFNNSNRNSSKNIGEFFGPHHRAPSPLIKKSTTLKNVYHHNNRYQILSNINKI